MAHTDPSSEALAAITTELAELRAALSAQQETITQQQTVIEQQQAAIAALQGEAAEPEATPELLAEDSAETPAAEAHAASFGRTSRRGLLRGAAAGAAAAAVATVAVGGATTAHAAPEATGGNFILGQTNDADAATILQPTSGASPRALLTINNPTASSSAITTSTSSGSGIAATDTGAGTALYGFSAGGVGAGGYSSSGNGVQGTSDSGMGVWGNSTWSQGVLGQSQSNYGVQGSSGSTDDLAATGTGLIFQKPSNQFGPPTSGTYRAGESMRDSNGDLWLCVWNNATGQSQWAKVALLAPGYFGGGAITYLGKPIRIFDSRANFTDAAFHPGKPCTSSGGTIVPIGDVSYNGITVPHTAVGAVGNVTVTNTTGEGYLEVVPSGAGFTGAANIAYVAGQTISNAFNVELNGGALDIIIGGASTDVIIDLFAIVS